MFSSGREASQFSIQVREQFASYKSRSGSGDLLEITWNKKKKKRERRNRESRRALELRELSGTNRKGKRKKERMRE